MIAHGFYTRNGLILTDCLLFGFYIILINFASMYFIVKKNIVIVLSDTSYSLIDGFDNCDI